MRQEAEEFLRAIQSRTSYFSTIIFCMPTPVERRPHLARGDAERLV